MWAARNKTDLIIEVWEKLDCESVGASEIESIETVLMDTYGEGAAGSHMAIARLLADEGAVLRHSELLEHFYTKNANGPYDAAFRNILRISDLREALSTIGRLEGLRKKYAGDRDEKGTRLVKEAAIEAKNAAARISADERIERERRMMYREITEWFRIWLHSPGVFSTWIERRRGTEEYSTRFGDKEG